jgi:hypothetical protein
MIHFFYYVSFKQKYAYEICYSRWQVIALTKSVEGFEFNMLNEKIVPICVKKGRHFVMTVSREEVPHGENIRE